MAVLTADGIAGLRRPDRQPVEKERCHVDWDDLRRGKGRLRALHAQGDHGAARGAAQHRLPPHPGRARWCWMSCTWTTDYLRELDKHLHHRLRLLLPRGHGGQVHPGAADCASRWRWRWPPSSATATPSSTDKTLVIVISQSGETLDTLAALREAKRLGARMLSIVNVVGSSIAREADDVLYTWAGPEIAVATTKAYSTQLAVMYLHGPVLRRGRWAPWTQAEYDRHCVRAAAASPTSWSRSSDSRDGHPVFRLPATSTTTPSSSSAATWTTPWAWRAPSSSRRSPTSTRRPTPPASSSTAPSPSSSRAPWWWPWPPTASSLTRP